MSNRKSEIFAALSKVNADLILKNAKVVNVFTHQTELCDIAIYNGKIVGLGKYEGENEYDVAGNYVMPSFIDSHCHIESSMLSPVEYAKLVVAKGIGTIIADPHEIANVSGEDGLKFMLDCAENLPLDIHYMLPSCVPATPFDSSGAVIDCKKCKELMDKYSFKGLGEMMDFVSLLNGSEEIMNKLDCAEIIDGHSPSLSGKELCAYITSGVLTDHECSTEEEALERVARGMYVQIREGTSAKNLTQLVKAITPINANRFLFCTDDKHFDDIMEQGTISNCVKKAISLGVDPYDAIMIATLNAAQCYKLKNLGAVAPGYLADLIICDSIDASNILRVYKNGKLVAENGVALFDKALADSSSVRNTVHINPVTADSFKMEFSKNLPVIRVEPDTLVTYREYRDTPDNLCFCACIERHKGTCDMGKGFVTGFSVRNGAVAQTIGHDSHNITVVGSNTDDMALAVNSMGKDGGIVVVVDGKVEGKMLLPISGLMTDKSSSHALEEYLSVKHAMEKLAPNSKLDTLMVLSFLSLCVIPEIRVSDKGLFDVTKMEFIKKY